MSQYDTVDKILNRVAAELGFDVSSDPLTDGNQVFTQLRYLMNSTAEELLQMHQWTEMQKEHTITTVAATDTGSYPMPIDFMYMIPQTWWERSNNNPVLGPMSPQDWQYLKGRDLSSTTIYASFRLQDREIHIYPDNPVVDALTIYFEYMSDNWILDIDNITYHNEVDSGADTVLFPKIIMVKFLKVKYLEAKGFDSTKAREDFAVMMLSTMGHDGSAPVLNAGGRSGFPYLDTYRNTPDTGYGA